MQFLSENERDVLVAFCDTIHPRLSDDRLGNVSPSASDMGVTALVERAMNMKNEHAKERLRLLLRLLQRRAVNGVLAGHWAPFTKLTVEQRTDVLLAMANSPFNRLRGAFQNVKQLVSFLTYSFESDAHTNPHWQLFDYQGKAKCVSTTDDALPIVHVDHDQTIRCDVLVIGSGAGGGVMAAELAAAGQDVVVVEKGDYFSNSRLPDNELDGMRKLYEESAGLRTADRAVIVLAGSTLGGGTTVNWMTCLDPPEKLRQQWAHEHGFAAVRSAEFTESIRYVRQRIHATNTESQANFQNAALERGCRALGYDVSVIDRNVKDCQTCDFCSFGCRYGAKQDTRRTFLRDAVDQGARILVRTHVDRITHERGIASGAVATVSEQDGEAKHRVEIRCNRVILAAGAVHSPAILIRSGLTNHNIGRNLHLHPTGGVFARYEQPVQAWRGAPQTRVCEHFADLDGNGYGFRLEASPAHPGLWALGLPWQGGKPFRELMRQVPYLANTIVLTRDRYSGQVHVDGKGRPVLHYKVHPYDARHLMMGLQEAIRVHRAAGAQTVYGPHNDCMSFECSGSDVEFECYLQRVKDAGSRTNHLGLFCAHQMSTCRIGGSATQGAVNPEGESFEVKNLFVADGSALPTSTGVNPMITILATAHHVAQHVKSRLAV